MTTPLSTRRIGRHNGFALAPATITNNAAMSRVAIFRTNLGWFGLVGDDRNVLSLRIGHSSADEVRDAVAKSVHGGGPCEFPVESDWNPDLRSRLQHFAAGEPVEFDDVAVHSSVRTAFQRRVVAATRGIRYGDTLTYGQLARRAGSPHAARAVGQVMSSNPFPIIVPCHRVVAANGKLGGFSAPEGVRLKRRMLDLEAGLSSQTQTNRRPATMG